MVNPITDIIVSISAVVVAVAAVVGISTWRKELTGKAIFEAAKRMMESAYRVVDGYQWTTNLMTYSPESADRPGQQNESDTVKLVLDEGFARGKRLQTVLHDYNTIADANYEVRTILGLEASKRIQDLLLSMKMEIWNLSSAIYIYFDIRRKEADSGIESRDGDFKNKMRSIVYQSPDSDEIKKLNSLVSDLDKELAPYLRGARKGVKK
jgi:hypothetical protein